MIKRRRRRENETERIKKRRNLCKSNQQKQLNPELFTMLSWESESEM
jgi:hypothetical protein